MVPSKGAYIISAIVVVVSFASAALCEVVWSRGVEGQMIDECTAHLAKQAEYGDLTREGYASLVQNVSRSFIDGQFELLPLKYRSLFHMHACMKGRPCIGKEATVAISTKEERRMTCSTLASQIIASVPAVNMEGTCVQVSANESLAPSSESHDPSSCKVNGAQMTAVSMNK